MRSSMKYKRYLAITGFNISQTYCCYNNYMISILVVEDNKNLNKIICKYLTDTGYSVDSCYNPNEAYDLMYKKNYDLIVSDIMMPEIDGFEFAKDVRMDDKTIPILFVTAKDDFESKEKGFKLGIDDYMVKPLDMSELVLRVEALLRRAGIASEKRLTVGNLTMDEEAMSVTVDGENVPTTVREFNILYRMLSYPGKIFSRSKLLDDFWDMDSETGLRAVDVYMTKLRKKFARCDGFKIETVHGLGYKAVLNE